MFDWVAANKELLIALFGTGGAGAIALSAILSRKRGDGVAKPAGPSATASGGGIAVVHGGSGNIDVRQNDVVGRADLDRLQSSLGLSLAEAVRLLRSFRAAGLDLAQGEAAVARIMTQPERRDALVAALCDEDLALAAAIIATATVSSSTAEQPNESKA